MAAQKRCRANVGTRTNPHACGEPVADGMLACCRRHRAVLIPTSTPGIYTRGGSYVVVWRHRGKQHKSFHNTLAEAREAKGGRQSGNRKPATKAPFEEYVKGWLESYQGRTTRGLDEGTRDSYRRVMELHAIPFFSGWRLADVEQKDVRQFVSYLQGLGLAPSSVRRYVATLKAMFATAVEDGDLPSGNPTLGVRINARRDASHEDEADPAKAMTREQLARLLAAVPNQWRLLFELLSHTGLRISEALGLDWEDLVLGDRPRLRVRRQYYRGRLKRYLKSNAGRRELPLSPGMARKLWSARPTHASGPMFATRNGTRLQDRNVRRVLDRVTHPREHKRTGQHEIVPAPAGPDLDWVGFHTFRHTCASLLLEAGKNIRQVAAWLGHEDPAFTLRTYTHLLDSGLGDAAFLDELAYAIPGQEAHPNRSTLDQHNTQEVVLDATPRRRAK